MAIEKHFIDTSVMRPLISSSTAVKSYYAKEFPDKLYYCAYIKVEFIKGFIIPAINFYFTLRLPNIKSISDALSLWSNKFQIRQIKALLSMISGLLESSDFDFNDLGDKIKASQRVADYIRRIMSTIPHKFTDIGTEAKLCYKSGIDINFKPEELDIAFKEFIESFNEYNKKGCNLHLFIERHQTSINTILKNQNITISDSQPKGFKEIVEHLSSGIKYNCRACEKLGDLIIALISPKEMRLEHTDYSFDYLMVILNKRHFRHPSENKILDKVKS